MPRKGQKIEACCAPTAIQSLFLDNKIDRMGGCAGSKQLKPEEKDKPQTGKQPEPLSKVSDHAAPPPPQKLTQSEIDAKRNALRQKLHEGKPQPPEVSMPQFGLVAAHVPA